MSNLYAHTRTYFEALRTGVDIGTSETLRIIVFESIFGKHHIYAANQRPLSDPFARTTLKMRGVKRAIAVLLGKYSVDVYIAPDKDSVDRWENHQPRFRELSKDEAAELMRQVNANEV